MPKHMSPAAPAAPQPSAGALDNQGTDPTGMAVSRRVAANRANAKKSTGPRTPEGKAKVSQNAVKHGLLAESIIPPALEPYESRAEFDALLAALRDEHRPATITEDLLVQSIAANHWRLKRLGRVESALIARRQDAVRRSDAFGMPEPHTGIAQLTAALIADPVDLPALRAIFVIPGAQREGYPDAAIVELAQGTLATLQHQHEAALARWRTLADLESSLPAIDTTHRLGRYGADLNRQIIHALRELRELKALRKAEQAEAEAVGPDSEPERCSSAPVGPIPPRRGDGGGASRRGDSGGLPGQKQTHLTPDAVLFRPKCKEGPRCCASLPRFPRRTRGGREQG